MANRLISPSLADLDQDIAGVIPVDLILRWSLGQKDTTAHKALLEPYILKGTVVSSDSAGLSKMSQEKTLFEVMKLVSEPKEVIFNYAKALNGLEIGKWAADNTEIFYDQKIPVDDIVQHMSAAQTEINHLTVHVGLGIHHGQFIHLGGGLFGDHADLVEELAENNTSAGEIALTAATAKKLNPSLQKLLIDKPVTSLKGQFYSIAYQGAKLRATKSGQIDYPYPFTKDFFQLLRKPQSQATSTAAYKKYSHDKIVILVKLAHTNKKFLLDELSDWVLANIILKKITRLAEIEEIKSNGSLGIFVTDNVTQAIEFAEDLRDTLKANGYVANVGVCKGEILVFPLDNGQKEIAGEPVNIASKLAEDCGERGCVMIENSVPVAGKKVPAHEKFSLEVSHVELQGIKF